MALLLNEEIKFPHWDGDPQCEPYGTYKVLADALKYGRSLDAAMRAADDEELLIDNDDVFTRKLILKAVDLRRADVVRFMVERGADLNHVWEVTTSTDESLLHAAVWRGRHSDAAFVLDLGGSAVDVDVPLHPNGVGISARNRTPLMRAADRACIPCSAEEEAARLATVKLLLHHGANLQARDRYGHRAHQIAHIGSSARALLNDVRAAGGWRPYARRGFHGDRREMLVLRVLCERGRATTDDALLSRLFPCVESARASDDEVVEAPARRLDPVDRDAFRNVFSFWPPLSRVIGGQPEDELDAASVKRMTLPKLKAALSERGLDATGPKGSVKATLRERLLGVIESSPW